METNRENTSDGGDRTDKIKSRTIQIAQDASKTAAQNLETDLKLFGANSKLEEMVRKKQEEVFAETCRLRESGEMNDDYSQAPGLSVFFHISPEEDRAEIVEFLVGHYPFEPSIPEDMTDCLQLDIPEGLYSASFGAMQIHANSAPDGEGHWNPEGKVAHFPYRSVVRVEGHSGELWQNMDFLPDGNPKV